VIRKIFVVDGRSESDIDPLLSRRHAEFVLNENGAIVRDLQSRNGILVNGVKLVERLLEPGDVVQLGHLHVRYVEEEPPTIEYDPSSNATTATGMAPTVAVLAALPLRPDALVTAPDELTRAPALDEEVTTWPAAEPVAHAVSDPVDDAGLDITTLPASARPADPLATPPPRTYSPDDFDSTRLAASKYGDPEATRAAAPARPARPAIDLDATMIMAPPIPAAERSAPRPAPRAVAERSTDAWLVTDASLAITEASPTCARVLGLRSDTIVGGQLAEVLAKALGVVSAGDGPSPLSLSIERTPSNGALTITFTAGKASGISS
jgi:hypothetical protein